VSEHICGEGAMMRNFWIKIKSRLRPPRKNAAPSALICSEVFESMSILADGSVTCACTDIFEGRVLGNVNTQPLEEIFGGERYRDLRRRMISGDLPPQCVRCPLRVRPRTGNETVEGRGIQWLQIDPIFNCNLRCPNCDLTRMWEENFFIRPRTALSLEAFKKVIDEASPTLKHIRFHMLGEPLMNPQSVDMLRYAREKIPHLFISIETNGLFIGAEMQKALVETSVDYVKISVDGASQETYVQYRVGGDFSKVYQNMAGLVATRNAAGSDRPRITWQYILFEWNDSDEEIQRAQELARMAGVDHLYWLATHSTCASKRFLPGGKYPIFEGEGQSFNMTLEIAASRGESMARPAASLDAYDPWK